MPSELIHAMIRVLDEERSLACDRALWFEERGRARVGGDTATVIFLGPPGDGARLELTLNDGRAEPYEIGEGYGHGIAPERDPYEAYPGGPKIFFVRDPDGSRIEFLERNPADHF